MRGWLPPLILVAAAVPATAVEPLAVIDGCIRRLDPTLDVGYTRIASRCPDLAPALSASSIAPWLPADWSKPNNALSVGGLAELRRLLARPPLPVAVRVPRVEMAGAVLQQLKREEDAQRSWWTRFKEWLRRIMADDRSDDGTSWLKQLLGFQLAQGVRALIVGGSVLAVLVLAGAILINELRVAGILGRARRSRGHAAEPAISGGDGAPLALSASDAQAPQLLLELVVRRLREEERLPPARALTVRELGRMARLRDVGEQERLALLGDACERARFASAPLTDSALAAAVRAGRELLAALTVDAPRAGETH
jgi:hypothetical protein